MLKRFSFVLFLILLLLNVNAYIYLLSPYEKKLTFDETLVLKYVQPGETLVLQIDRENGISKWSSAKITSKWQSTYELTDKTLVIKLKIDPKETQTLQNVRITLSDPSGYEEGFDVAVFIKKDLIKASLKSNFNECKVGETASYEIVLVNESLAEHSVRITSSLPKTWFDKLDVVLKPKQTKIVSLTINANSSGKRDICFYVDSLLFDKRFANLNAELAVFPTLPGKFTASYFGLPFFTLNMLPSYMLNALLIVFS